MKSIMRSSLLSLLIMTSIATGSALAELYSFTIIEGQVDTSSQFCATRPDCPVMTSDLSGKFKADIQNNTAVFSDIQIKVTPDTGFELPRNPNIDSDGTTRSIVFWFDGEVLEVSGTLDNSAFDGPLYEYRFAAKTTGSADFDPSGFFEARPDFRKCMWPLCGGMFLSAVNRPFTRCADGRYAKECYVASLNWKPLGFDPLDQDAGPLTDTTYVFKGHIESQSYDDFKNLGVFVGEGAYRPVSDNTPHGFHAGLQDNDIVCVTWPCFSVEEYILNFNHSKTISGFGLDTAGASAEDKQAALELLGDGEVLIAAGTNQWVKGPAGYGLSFVAEQFYLPIKRPIGYCDDGYEYRDGRCLTPHDCEAPLIELKTIGGMPNPETGEAVIGYSCVAYCIPPEMTYIGPARCDVHMP